jgi:hypothetical protein
MYIYIYIYIYNIYTHKYIYKYNIICIFRPTDKQCPVPSVSPPSADLSTAAFFWDRCFVRRCRFDSLLIFVFGTNRRHRLYCIGTAAHICGVAMLGGGGGGLKSFWLVTAPWKKTEGRMDRRTEEWKEANTHKSQHQHNRHWGKERNRPSILPSPPSPFPLLIFDRPCQPTDTQPSKQSPQARATLSSQTSAFITHCLHVPSAFRNLHTRTHLTTPPFFSSSFYSFLSKYVPSLFLLLLFPCSRLHTFPRRMTFHRLFKRYLIDIHIELFR